jgi:RNA polymerase sigma-70 factor (ECF subfamily)
LKRRDQSVELAKAEPIALSGSPEAAALSETALIQAAQRKDPDAFEQLVRLYDRSVMRVTLNLLRSPEDARDAYQEAFIKVYNRLETFRFQCSFHTWLYRIATNVCLDQLRRKGVRKERMVDDRDDQQGHNPLQNAADSRPGADPEQMLEGRRLNKRIREAMEDLSPKEKVVFEMRHYEGLRLRAIGDVMGISEEAAKNCLFRATRKLRAALADVR